MGGKSKGSSKDPLQGQRTQATDDFMSMYGDWKTNGPQVPTFMQGAASTLGPMTSTLNESIATGLPTNVTELGNAEREKALLSLNRDIFPQMLEKFGMGGQRFGSDTMNAMGRTAGDVVTNLGINQLQQGITAQENAAGRRLMATQLASLPADLQKKLMMIPELLQFVSGAMPESKQSGFQFLPNSGVSASLGK